MDQCQLIGAQLETFTDPNIIVFCLSQQSVRIADSGKLVDDISKIIYSSDELEFMSGRILGWRGIMLYQRLKANSIALFHRFQRACS